MSERFPRTDLKLEVLYHEDRQGYDWLVTLGDDDVPVTRVEPWMLEAVVVASEGLRVTREKLERVILHEFGAQADALRAAKRMLAQAEEKIIEKLDETKKAN